MSEAAVRLGFIGAGEIARRRHLPSLQKIRGVELLAVANLHRGSAEKVAKDFGFKAVADHWQEIVERKDIDAVFIAAPPLMHKIGTIAALDAGKHVFCQARMAMDYADAKEMYLRSRQVELVTMICPPPHWLAGDYFITRLLREGYVGRPLDLDIRIFADSFLDPNGPVHWRQNSDISGYNTLSLGIFAEAMHRWLGFARSVNAFAKTHIPRRRHPETGQMVEVKIADSVAVAAELENGVLANMHLTGMSRFPSPNRIEIYGSEGTLVYDTTNDKIFGGRIGDVALQPMPVPADERREWRAEADFIHAIRHGGTVSPDFWEGLKYMEFTEAVYRSAESGKAVDLPLDSDLRKPYK